MEPYRITPSRGQRIPIIVSVPHCGIAFPEEIIGEFDPELVKAPDDTDWFVDQLYGFAPSMGITMIAAVFSRWVIDLNRDPANKPLYSDGRIITDLCPTTTFLGQPLYRDKRSHVARPETERRRRVYFEPYHQKVRGLLSDLKNEFGIALLWDCHSIRRVVSTIRKDAFPDLILGSAAGTSAHKLLIEEALQRLSRGGHTLQHNDPFKGGYITRTYGQPTEHQHALQLEMAKINYMDDAETRYDRVRAAKMEELLFNTLSGLGKTLISLKDR